MHLRADAASYNAKGGNMPIGKRSPARSSSARKVNAVVSPIGDDTGTIDTQRGSVSKSGIVKTARATSKSRASKATSALGDATAVESLNHTSTKRSRVSESITVEKPRSSRSPSTAPDSRRPKRPSHATQLARERAAQRREDAGDMAFFGSWGHGHLRELDEVGQDFAEQFLTGVTSGQEAHAEAQDRIWEMELGGPFVISSDKRELGRGRRGMDGFESEAFPTPSAPSSVPAFDELEEEEED
jgi:hypothetical protein